MAEFLRASGAGVVVPPGDAAGVADAIRRLRSLPGRGLELMGRKGWEVVSDGYQRRQLNERLIRVIEAVSARRPFWDDIPEPHTTQEVTPTTLQ
jgi:glycosyltransferase involved in cell wall biosynthesis